jgi:hypothetical protein
MAIPRWRLALAAGALVILGAVGGGLVQASATASSAAADADAPAASTADNALLLDSIALTSDPTSSGAAVPAQLLGLRDRLQGRLAYVRRHLVHGTLTVLDRDGKLVTYQLDHGTVSAVGSASITIAEAGGSSVTVATTSETRVRKDAKASTLADLKAGDEVLIRSTVVGSSASANLVVVPPANPWVTTPSRGGNG